MDPPGHTSSRNAKMYVTDGSTAAGPSSAPTSRKHNSRSKSRAVGRSSLDISGNETWKENVPKLAPNSTLGQFSLAPATQTTVVTTTTTTTLDFPPLEIKAPRNMEQRDTADYPLLVSRTPACLRGVEFKVGGQAIIFREPEDSIDSVNKWQQQQEALQDSKGVLRSVVRTQSDVGTPISRRSGLQKATGQHQENLHPLTRKHLDAPPSPPSISKAARLAGQSRPRKRRHDALELSDGDLSQSDRPTQSPSRPRSQHGSRSTPSRTVKRSGTALNGKPKMKSDEHQASEKDSMEIARSSRLRSLSSRPELSWGPPFPGPISSEESSQVSMDLPSTETREDSDLPGAVTPVRTEDDVIDQPLLTEEEPRARRPQPRILTTTVTQDMSLPSPSLSPVTAALNMRNRTSYFDESHRGGNNELSSIKETFDSNQGSLSEVMATGPLMASQDQAPTPTTLDRSVRRVVDAQPPTASMMDVPNMIDTFDALPPEMQEFVMFQLLKRSSKPVLKFVAEVVNPALKCNFLVLLPLELSLQVLSHLDIKSLCRTAQVSRKWRQIVDSDEKAWKRLFDLDGYTLPDGELDRAIQEGWGWQHASRPDDWERNLGAPGNTHSDTESVSSHHALTASGQASSDLAPPPTKRSKRKLQTRTKGHGHKQQKRQDARSTTPLRNFDAAALLEAASGKEGPYAAASAAALAIPYSNVGVPSLRNLHLFKSIYQRHHIIRKSWMQDKTKPKHIAFRAHQRHVVTCLQFDTEKILTGSDDTHINVYDTQTGALRKKLAGHEGGVWALQYQGDVLVSGSTDRSVRVWDIKEGRCTQVFQGHTSTVRCLQILMPAEVGKTSDGRSIMLPKQPLIITGSRDSNLRVWKLPRPGEPEFFQAGPPLDDNECPYFVRVLTGHHHSVRAIAAHADVLVSGSYDCTVRVWKISTGEMIHRLAGHTQKVYSVVLDHKRNRCISGSMDNMVKVWSLDTGSVLYNLEGHTSLVGLLDLQQDRLVSAAADSTLRIWDPETGSCKATLKAHTGAITCFQHDGQKVISGSDRTLKMWNVTNGKLAKDLLTDLSGVWQVNFNERRCVAAVQRNGLTYIEVLDFGAARDGVPESQRGHRIVVDAHGNEMIDTHDITVDTEAMVEE
ncbi:MAG: hypothetical protein Q9220_004995 [cf. Caloplaca sp. 1 TL-2023]